MKVLTICATGHRPNKLNNAYELTHPLAIEIGKEMRKKILELSGYDKNTNSFRFDKIKLISGMALGVDTYFVKVALKLRNTFPTVFEVEAAIPHIGHGEKWPEHSKEILTSILKEVDISTIVSETPYSKKVMQIRNEYMVNQSDVIMAIWDGSKGGTGNCITYALTKNKNIVHYHPFKKEWKEKMKQ